MNDARKKNVASARKSILILTPVRELFCFIVNMKSDRSSSSPPLPPILGLIAKVRPLVFEDSEGKKNRGGGRA